MTDASSETTAPGPRPDADPGAAEAAEFESDLASLQSERDDLLDTTRRLQADFENYRKRVVREQTALVERSTEGLLEQLLPVLDSFELAVRNLEGRDGDEKVRKGIELVYAELGNAEAEDRFKDISAAYDVFGDAKKRAEYDEVLQMVASGVGPDGSSGFGSGGGRGSTFRFETDGGGLGDIFGNLFGGGGGGRRRTRAATGPQRGRDLETELHLSFDDSIRGVTSTVRFRADATCSTCAGSGAAPGSM